MTRSSSETPELPPQPIYTLRDYRAPEQPEPFYQHYESGIPIAIDLGSSQMRVGLAGELSPNNVFPTVVARYRDRKAATTLTLVGNDAYRDLAVKSSIKSPFDGALITNWDYTEVMLDYAFEHLGVVGSAVGGVDNPIVMTESVCCPFSQRRNMYELLFENYQAPSVAFGVDSLFSFYANSSSSTASGVVIGTGHELTHVIPVLNGKGILSQTKRIDWGGDQCQNFLSKLLMLKYPYFASKLTPSQSTNLFEEFCYILKDYQEELSNYLSLDVLEEKDIVAQAPIDFHPVVEKKKTEEELARQAEKRREQGRRLQEQAQQKRKEKLQQKQEEYEYYSQIKNQLEDMNTQDVLLTLQDAGFDDIGDFNKYLTGLEKTLKKSQDGDDDPDQVEDPATAWPLVDIPDEELNDEEKRAKKRQRLHKANWEAREKAKEQKKQEEEEKIRLEKEQQEWRERDLEDWCNTKRVELAEFISSYKERAKLLESFKDRKSAAAQRRMKNIADLANDEALTASSSRKRKRNATIDNDPNDTFGANDDDWSVYREINNTKLEEEQEEDQKRIVALEEELLKYDPDFHYEDTFAASQTFDWKNLILHKFIHGPRQSISISMQAEGKTPEEIASHPEIIKRSHQMHMNIERIRVPEVLFQPSMAGLDQAGVIELLGDLVLKRFDGKFFSGAQSYSLIQDIFITGGLAKLPNFSDRVFNDLQALLPAGSPLKVRLANDPQLDAWKGMSKWARAEESKTAYISRAEYDEYGPEYIKEHGLGNVCLR